MVKRRLSTETAEGESRGIGVDTIADIAMESTQQGKDICDHDDDFDEDGYPKIVNSKNGLYEWGFDFTSFDDDDQDGVVRFRELLSVFGLEEILLERTDYNTLKFVWASNNDNRSLKLVTCNNPITGQSGAFVNGVKLLAKGYLGYVGVESDSAELLHEFIQEFRKRATDIKEESNSRAYT